MGAPTNRQVLIPTIIEGDRGALDKLTAIVYEELRRLARYYMKGERASHTLQTTALENEAYLQLVDYKRM